MRSKKSVDGRIKISEAEYIKLAKQVAMDKEFCSYNQTLKDLILEVDERFGNRIDIRMPCFDSSHSYIRKYISKHLVVSDESGWKKRFNFDDFYNICIKERLALDLREFTSLSYSNLAKQGEYGSGTCVNNDVGILSVDVGTEYMIQEQLLSEKFNEYIFATFVGKGNVMIVFNHNKEEEFLRMLNLKY